MFTRRASLRFCGVMLGGLAGCVTWSDGNEGAPTSPTEQPSETPTSQPTTNCQPTAAPAGGASIAIYNHLNDTMSVRVSIASNSSEKTFEETYELVAGGRVLERDAITEVGESEIKLALDGEIAERRTIMVPDENDMPLGAYTVTIYIDEDIEFVVLHGDPAPTPPDC